jgi:uncharacterized membrane protein
VQVQRSDKGFVLIVTCIALIILLALAVLSIDIGRMRVIKSELQAFTDAAALNAALQLDGSDPGLARARIAAVELASGPNAMKWDIGTQSINAIQASFAKGDLSPDPKTWQPKPADAAADYRFARVQASAPAPIIFFRVFQPSADSTSITAASVAMKTPETARLVQ